MAALDPRRDDEATARLRDLEWRPVMSGRYARVDDRVHVRVSAPASRLAALGTALLRVLASAGSLTVALLAVVILAGLIRVAHPTLAPAAIWSAGIALALGIPVALSLWRHGAEGRAFGQAMTWLPGATNASLLVGLVLVLPDPLATSLRSLEWVVQGRLDDDHAALRTLSALGHEAADTLRAPVPPAPPAGDDPRLVPELAIDVAVTAQGTAIIVPVMLSGPEGTVEQQYLFDTGASFSTITTATADALGIVIPEDAPALEFSTASGLRRSRMVYLPALTVGDVTIEGLLVSVCDGCRSDRTEGLLGLNVTRNFVLAMDYGEERMQLIPRIPQGRPNRAFDIEPMVALSIAGKPEIWLGRIRWTIAVTNRSDRPIEGMVPRVQFEDGPTFYGEVIERIEPGTTGRSLVVGKVGEEGDERSFEFTLSVAEAHW